MSLAERRREYRRGGLSRDQLDPDPVRQFDQWLHDAIHGGVPEPTAAALATAAEDGRPSVRTVLLKSADRSGFRFFTSYRSPKARDLEVNPRAAMLWFWPELERQVRVEGPVARVTPQESDEYFATRPRGSQLGAWASEQSSVIPSRDVLERRLREVEAEFADRDVPRPPAWGGYRLVPEIFEFWQGRENRLHDRFRYRRDGDTWVIERLAP